MRMWFYIFLVAFISIGLSLLFLVRRLYKQPVIQRFSDGNKIKSWLISAGVILIIGLLLYLLMGFVNAFVCFLHYVGILLMCDLVSFIICTISKKDAPAFNKELWALIVTVVVLLIGWYLANHVFRTEYTIHAGTGAPNIKIVQFADSHVGATFNAEGFSKHVDTMQSENPDIVLITGDFVDDGTSREEMLASCKALSKFNTKYGVYFSYGNHDKGYNSAERRGWTVDEFAKALTDNGVKILEDEAVLIDDNICLIGRGGAFDAVRPSIGELTEGFGDNVYKIVMDHIPNDYDAEEKAGVDLVLSGHTHGGQLIPITFAGEWLGANDKTYGLETRGKTNFIVTSGISDWEIIFKTGCKSEYVVINVVE